MSENRIKKTKFRKKKLQISKLMFNLQAFL